MDKFVLDDIREFCLCCLDNPPSFKKLLYIPVHYRVFVWKVLKCNKMFHLLDLDVDNYMEELKTKISPERLEEIWNFTIPIYNKLKEYSTLNFKPSPLYLRFTLNGKIKEEIFDALRKSGAHSWVSNITPATEKFWVSGDFTFSDFCDNSYIKNINIPKEYWNFHREIALEIQEQ